ncbi:hypothetical protein LL240_09620 [Oceanimonas baumannii]|uniref:hypothetical protein n=1 Tax=Oceanimonas baumannii TaxID=129578 RepID=UPI001D192391|nr:hypothetical protein [Oceanimonas baumannii]MCC4264713.1 hypothetical protein [Oceanimonas baumannii]
MGLFDVFKRKKDADNIESVLIGYFRVETSKLLGHEVDSKEFDKACESAGEHLQVMLIPLLNRDIQQKIADTISSVCPSRFDEAFGQYMILLFVRFSVIQKAILEGRVKSEEATPDILANVIHDQIRNLIRQV